MRACVCAKVDTSNYVSACVNVYVRVCVCVCVLRWTPAPVRACMCVCAKVNTSNYVSACVDVCVCVCDKVDPSTCACVHVCVRVTGGHQQLCV